MTLDQLGIKHGTDKSSKGHGYCSIYQTYLHPLWSSEITLLEAGYGGYNYPDRGGESARMWLDYFPKGKIISVDIYEKINLTHPRFKFYQGSQIDEAFLQALIFQEGRPDVIIDDASHHNELTRKTFEILFPLLKSGGLYIVEDVHTSYWVEEYGGNPDPDKGETAMNYFKRLTDQLNHEVLEAKYKGEFAGQIQYIHFYPELIIIKKK